MIEVSIVSGTYNRLESLKRMVNSVRRSVGDFQHYEIVLVDGGSADGTIEWCKSQADIRLIEQGELLGAVKAFNAGAEAAAGRYVILANDDVFFIDESILNAVAFMDSNPTVGVGCFYQNRNGKEWHVEQMPAIGPDGKQCSAPYGQVCIVPKVLGATVGWWGDYLHTYGGDNELSCQIYEAGYHVMPIQCSCIADMMVHDGLRDKNGGDPLAKSRQGVTHPDSAKWQQKWRKAEGTGPNISIVPKYDYRNERKLRIMYMPLFEPGNMIQRRTKVGLRNALQKKGMVVQWDYMRDGLAGLFDYSAAWQPDIFMWQVQNASRDLNVRTIRELKQAHPNAKHINWNGDYHPENLFDDDFINMMKEFSLFGMVTVRQDLLELYDVQGIKHFYWQIGYEESSAEPTANTPEYDVLFLGNGYNASRIALGEFLVGLRSKGLKVGLYGSWPKDWASGENLYDFDDGQRLMRNSKLIISSQEYPEATGFVSNRLFQALAAGGGMVLQQHFEGMYLIGFKQAKHVAIWANFADLESAIDYYLANDKERIKIAKAGTAECLKNHSFDKRVEELFAKLRQV